MSTASHSGLNTSQLLILSFLPKINSTLMQKSDEISQRNSSIVSHLSN